MQEYDFKKFKQELNHGFQVYCTYVKNRYLIYKSTDNCYVQKLLNDTEKNPQPRMSMITLKRLKEMFPFMEDIEYHIGISHEKDS